MSDNIHEMYITNKILQARKSCFFMKFNYKLNFKSEKGLQTRKKVLIFKEMAQRLASLIL